MDVSHLSWIYWNTQGIGRRTKTTRYKTPVLPVLLCGSERWTLTEEEERKMNASKSKGPRKTMMMRWQVYERLNEFCNWQKQKEAEDNRDIKFFINGEKHSVSDKYPPNTTLNDYIRDAAGLKGTKVMCKEAGCGCCAVTVTHASDGNKAETMSINSCVCPLYSVDGWQISTVEGIGNQKKGFHPIQERLAKYNGTQCGYCSPGFVMSMYGLLHQNPKATQQDIEDSLDGHLCRCTGYRSILDAMKTFGSDSTAPEKAMDIEDLNKYLCPETGEVCKRKVEAGNADKGLLPRNLELTLYDVKWYRPLNLKKLREILQQHNADYVKLFVGNTASGIFKHGGPYEVYIDLRAIAELHEIKDNKKSIQVGAGTTLTKLMNLMKNLQDKPSYHYCKGVLRHLKVVANTLVRNAGCIAGNLMIKHEHPDFPSDVFTMMEAVGAKVEIFDSKGCSTNKYSLLEFLRGINMKGKVIVSIELPTWNETDHYRSYKITPRWQNAHAYVNAAFKIPVEDRKILAQPSIVVGGINAETVHASKTESFLKGKTLNDETISEALAILASELHPKAEPLSASPKYKVELATNLLYKTLLGVYKPTQYRIQSGGDSMERPMSYGLQSYQERTEDFPLRQPLPKKTAPLQTSGEAEYINDMPTYKRELAAAMVLSPIGSGAIKHIDTSIALNIPGVVRFIGASDVPKDGLNNFYPPLPFFEGMKEEVFVSKKIEFGGQLIGLVLAETQSLAEEGARKVKVSYENVQTPVIELEDAIAQNTIYEDRSKELIVGDPEAALKNSAFVVKGDVKEGTQAHFYMENQIALSVPSEDGMNVYSTAQWSDYVQRGVAQVIGKPLNYVNVFVPRLGGAFGGKFIQCSAISAAASVGAYTTGRPVRLNVDLSSNMKYASHRFPLIAKYIAGCDENGKMQAADIIIYVDVGCQPSPMVKELITMCDQGYHVPNWKIRFQLYKTNKPMGAPCRGPSAVPGSLIIETILEHMAKTVGQHPILFKEINLYETGQKDHEGIELTNCTLKELWKRLKQTAEISARMEDVKRFNANNLWRKRGLTMCSVKYKISHFAMGHPTQVSVFAGDGTVTVITSGIEMGQGLYMKVAQAVAKTFRIPLDNVKVRPNQNNVSPNSFYTGGSTGSESCVTSAIAACDAINQRLQPLREKMPEAGWVPLLNAAVFSGIPIFENTMVQHPTGPPKYFTYMAGATETEVDVLTGEYQIKRVDIMADVGESLNPTIDIGQVEGGYVMGLGTFLTENIHFDPSSGVVLNDGTWEYKPPTTKDIPIDWRVHFLPDSPNSNGILSSKAAGEPSIGLSVGALLAIKAGVENAREDLTNEKVFIPVEAPFTVEKAQQGANIGIHHLKVN